MNKSRYYYMCLRPMGGWVLHIEGCVNLPDRDKREFIGSLYTKQQALTVANTRHPHTMLCPVCLNSSPVQKLIPHLKHQNHLRQCGIHQNSNNPLAIFC